MHFQNIFTSALALGATALAIPIAKDAPAVTPVANITPRAKMPHHEKVIKISCVPFCVGKDAIDEICSKVCHGENDRSEKLNDTQSLIIVKTMWPGVRNWDHVSKKEIKYYIEGHLPEIYYEGNLPLFGWPEDQIEDPSQEYEALKELDWLDRDDDWWITGPLDE